MTNFCPKCGEKINSDDKFCKNCGFDLAAPVDIPKEQPTPEKISSSKNIARDIIKAFVQILLLGLFLYWAWYSYNCAVGNHLDSQDKMCQTFYQLFKGSNKGYLPDGDNRKNQVSIACQHCSPGYCWTEGHCCPNSSQYYCNGYCYRSSNEAYNAGCHQSNWTRLCCQ